MMAVFRSRVSKGSEAQHTVASTLSHDGFIYRYPQVKLLPSVHIAKDFVIPRPDLQREVRILHPFYIKLQLIRGDFLAVSDVSDIYETDSQPVHVVQRYLYSLADELIWFQAHKEELSPSLLHDLEKLQFYLRLV